MVEFFDLFNSLNSFSPYLNFFILSSNFETILIVRLVYTLITLFICFSERDEYERIFLYFSKSREIQFITKLLSILS